MKVSVIIPTYNRALLLQNAIKSVLNQTYKVDEIIVVDDGSTDNTQEVLKSFNVTYFYQENQGVSAARNRGIQHAKNKWLAFLDSDDIWHEKKIEHHITFHAQHQTLLASYTDETWVRNQKIISLKNHQQKVQPTFLNSMKLCKIGASTFFCHQSIFDAIGTFDESLKACEDYDLWLRILKHFPIYFINEKLTTKYAGHPNQLSFETKLIDLYRIKALKKHLNTVYKNEVLNELIYKTTLVLKGAKKHGNEALARELQKELNYFLGLK